MTRPSSNIVRRIYKAAYDHRLGYTNSIPYRSVPGSLFRAESRVNSSAHLIYQKNNVHQQSSPASFSTNTQQQQPTLFSLPNLSHPQDFLTLARIATESCDRIRKSLAASLQSPHNPDASLDESIAQAKKTLHLLDDISNEVCTVIDACELCRSVHASPEWRRAAGDAFGMLSEYIGALNADERLYLSLRRWVYDDLHSKMSTTSDEGKGVLRYLSPEYQRMAHAMRKEFERDGIHLSYNEREEARELNNVIVGLESLFSANITEKIKLYDVNDAMAGEVDKIVPRHILGQLVRGADQSTEGLRLSTDQLLTNTLLAHSPSSELRREVYMESNTSIPENLNVLDGLIRHRHLHSTLLGYKSYAHRVLSDRMVGSPGKVIEFLDSMENRCRDVFKKEMELLLKAKSHIEGTSSKIEQWDIPFYTNLIKRQRQHIRWKESGNAEDDEESQLSGYFTVENSIDGMKALVKDYLFGIDMVEVDIPEEEIWDIDTAANPGSTKSSGLRKFEFQHDVEGPLGTMYFDLHPRDGKFSHAAHFTIRCGRIRKEDSCDKSTIDHHQLPIVALVCNLSPSSSPDSSAAILSHSEVETLFHEFGHGLHSLLSRTSFQHLSGTRAAMDFVETPSHWMETYTRDPSFLSKVLARHYVTGHPMSEKRAKHLALSHLDFRGIEIQTQIVHSRFDQAIFGEAPCSPSLGGCTSTEMFEKLHKQAGVPYAVGTHWHSRFGHLVTYGAGYYSYLYAQTFAADIWKATMITPDGGMKIWKEMLIFGGAKDPKEMLVAVLGREPQVDAFFEGMS